MDVTCVTLNKPNTASFCEIEFDATRQFFDDGESIGIVTFAPDLEKPAGSNSDTTSVVSPAKLKAAVAGGSPHHRPFAVVHRVLEYT